MTTTTPNTRISDLNKLINHVEKIKESNPALELSGSIPECNFLEIVARVWLSDIGADNAANAYLWGCADSAFLVAIRVAEGIGIEDVSLLDPYSCNMPLMIAGMVAASNGVKAEQIDIEGLNKYGNTLVSDFFTKENN